MKLFHDKESYATTGWSSPAPRKYNLIAEAVKSLPIEIISPEKISEQDITRIHTKTYHDAVKTGNPKQLAKSQGFKWSPELYASVLLTNSGMYQSAKTALEERISGNIAGGFHHASKEKGAGLCTFNGLAIAIAKLQTEGKIGKAMVIDTDLHYGDGTAKIFQNNDSVFTFSLYGIKLSPTIQSKTSKAIPLEDKSQKEEYIAKLKDNIPQLITKFRPDLILYHSGADPHNGDNNSFFDLSVEDLAERDELIFQIAKQFNTPIAFTFGGGYGDISQIVKIHVNTIKKAQEVFEK